MPDSKVSAYTSALNLTTADISGIQSGVNKKFAISLFDARFQAVDTTLTALAAYNTNGILTQTAADTFTGRTVTGTANEITVTNGNGVSGNPVVSLPSALTFTGKTVTGGTFTGHTDTVVADGGTGVSSLAAYAVICGGTTSTGAVQSIASVGTSGQVLTSNGANALPTFQTLTVDYGAGNAALAYGGIGTYVFGYILNTGVTENSTYAGSSIEPAGIRADVSTTDPGDDVIVNANAVKGGSVLSGTWRAMGRVNVDSGSTRRRYTLFLRIS